MPGSCRFWDPVPLLALCILRHLRELSLSCNPSCHLNVDSSATLRKNCITISCHFFAPHSLWSLEFVLQIYSIECISGKLPASAYVDSICSHLWTNMDKLKVSKSQTLQNSADCEHVSGILGGSVDGNSISQTSPNILWHILRVHPRSDWSLPFEIKSFSSFPPFCPFSCGSRNPQDWLCVAHVAHHGWCRLCYRLC